MILHIPICTDLFRAVAFESSDNSATMVEVLSAFLEKLRNTCPVLWCDVRPPCGTGCSVGPWLGSRAMERPHRCGTPSTAHSSPGTARHGPAKSQNRLQQEGPKNSLKPQACLPTNKIYYSKVHTATQGCFPHCPCTSHSCWNVLHHCTV